MSKIKLNFGPEVKPAKLRLDFRPTVYMRDRTHTYLWLRDGYKFGYFLTMDSGSITVSRVDIIEIIDEPEVKADKKLKITAKAAVVHEAYRVFESHENFWDLVPYDYDMLRAVQKYHSSPLGRSVAAEREMRTILGLPPLAESITDADLSPAAKSPKVPSEPRASAGYTLQELCAELKLDPTEARKALRAAKIEKPGSRWEWPNAEAAAAVRAVLEAA